MLNSKHEQKKIKNLILSSIILFIGLTIGYILGTNSSKSAYNKMNSIRLKGYDFIRPLLVCDTEIEIKSKKQKNSKKKYLPTSINRSQVKNRHGLCLFTKL